MFVQIHMLQSMPPGNLNRDETGQPKKCIFGGVTRARISSQCLKRSIRRSSQFKEAFGDALAVRTTYLPRMVAEELKEDNHGVPEDELNDLMVAIAKNFSKKDGRSDSRANDGDQDKSDGRLKAGDKTGKTPQLVYFPQPFARHIAELIIDLRTGNLRIYDDFIGRKLKPKMTNEENELQKQFINKVSEASKSLTVDIGMFGRMTTSNMVVNVEAACQVAHAIGTHETLIESDYFTAMDDLKDEYASTQMDRAGAAFLGSGENETFFCSAVYYKYINLDIDALQYHMREESIDGAAHAAGILVSAAALANPTGKQNSFAAHGVPELVLVEVSETKRPISYANAFLQPVEGRNFMAESVNALFGYIDSMVAAYAPVDMRRLLLAVGSASVTLQSEHSLFGSLDELVKSVVDHITTMSNVGVSA